MVTKFVHLMAVLAGFRVGNGLAHHSPLPCVVWGDTHALACHPRADALALAGCDYLVLPEKVMAALAAEATDQGYNDGLSAVAGGQGVRAVLSPAAADAMDLEKVGAGEGAGRAGRGRGMARERWGRGRIQGGPCGVGTRPWMINMSPCIGALRPPSSYPRTAY